MVTSVFRATLIMCISCGSHFAPLLLNYKRQNWFLWCALIRNACFPVTRNLVTRDVSFPFTILYTTFELIYCWLWTLITYSGFLTVRKVLSHFLSSTKEDLFLIHKLGVKNLPKSVFVHIYLRPYVIFLHFPSPKLLK